MPAAPVLVDTVPEGAVVCDVRFYLDGTDPRRAFAAGHLPGAVYVDLATALSGPSDAGLGRHPLPSPEAFAAELGALGIADDDHVIGVDDLRGTIAARLVWMLRAIGRPASLLDGGLQAWDGDLATGPPAPRTPVRRTPVPWPEDRLADLQEVEAGVPQLLDVRPPARYSGEDPGLDPRPGHIPGARNTPNAGNLEADGTFRSPEALAERFADLDDPVVSCGSGVTACHTLLALELAGKRGRLFPGSFSQWAADPARPVSPAAAS